MPNFDKKALLSWNLRNGKLDDGKQNTDDEKFSEIPNKWPN